MHLRAALILAMLAAPGIAFAHAPKVGHNDGLQADAGSFHVEMVPDGSVLHVYLRDHSDKAISTEGYKGTAVLVIEGKAERISLTPDGENKLKGTASTPLPAEPKGAVQITTPTGGTVQAKFK
jgi:hypothetical protein